jgi:hypothetical protein
MPVTEIPLPNIMGYTPKSIFNRLSAIFAKIDPFE